MLTNRKLSATTCAWLLAVFVAGNSWALPTAELTLQSEPGDFVGGGQNKDIVYTPESSDFFFAQILDGLDVAGQPAYLQFTMGTVTGSNATNTFSTLDFATDQLNVPILPGVYDDAQRAPFAEPGHPGLDVTFQNRGSNTLTGSFTVNAVSFFIDASNVRQIAFFDVDFVQHSEGASPALFGHFVYQAVALPVPEPATLPLLAVGLAAIAIARSRRPLGASVG